VSDTSGRITSEKELVKLVAQRLEHMGCRTFSEVPFMYRSIDLVALRASGQCIAIEAKLADWRQALQQAKPCLLGAHKVYLAMPAHRAKAVDRAMLKAFGIGLIAIINNAPRVLVRARRSEYIMTPYSEALLDTIAKRSQRS